MCLHSGYCVDILCPHSTHCVDRFAGFLILLDIVYVLAAIRGYLDLIFCHCSLCVMDSLIHSTCDAVHGRDWSECRFYEGSRLDTTRMKKAELYSP